MGYNEVKDWLDKLTSNFRERQTLKELTTGIEICEDMNILIYKGIEMVADIMGIELKEITTDGYPVFLYFTYQDVRFLQVGRTN